MAFAATTIWEVNSGGSDSANGGGFDPSNASMATDLAATSATGSSPVVTSASYNFITRDNSQFLFIKSGTNWTPGLYPIVSTSGNAATLNAAIGAVVLYDTLGSPIGMNTVAGCATTASPTGGTWSIDYSRGTAAAVTFTDLVIDGTTNTKVTSAANPIGKNFVGNIGVVTSGTGFTTQRVQFVSVTGTAGTVDKSLGTLGSTGGNMGLGGALATTDQAMTLHVGQNYIAVSAGTYTTTTQKNFVAGAFDRFNQIFGYTSNRHLFNTDTRPVIQTASNITVLRGDSYTRMHNLEFSQTGTIRTGNGVQVFNGKEILSRLKITAFNVGIAAADNNVLVESCEFYSCTQAINANAAWIITGCYASACTGTAGAFNCAGTGCVIEDTVADSCNSGFLLFSGCVANKCVAYGSTTYGFGSSSSGELIQITNCVAVSCTTDGFHGDNTSKRGGNRLINCAGYNNGTNVNTTSYGSLNNAGFITLSADPFTNAASHDFTLNATAGGGAALKGAGWPATVAGLSPTNYPTIGAYQPSTASSGGPVGNNMRGGFVNG